MNIVQIGRGPTGTALARRLLPTLPAGSRYIVVDRDPHAQHLPFGTPEPTHLINTRAAKSSIELDDPGEFERWLGDAPHEFPPRALFGRYIRDMFDAAVEKAVANGVTVEVVVDAAQRVVPGVDRRWRVELAGGEAIEADRIALCTGMLPQLAPYPELLGAPGYFDDPWRLPELPPEATVAVLGTRLTAIDVALTLAARGHTGRVLLASRSGRLPRVRGSEELAPIGNVEQAMGAAAAAGRLRLEDFGRALMADIEAASTEPVDWSTVRGTGATTRDELAADVAEVDAGTPRGWQRVVNTASPVILVAWQMLDDADRAEFFAQWLTPLLVHGAPIPPATAHRLIDALDAGRLAVAGGLRGVRSTADGFEVDLGATTESVDVVVNATGAGTTAAALRVEPLLAAMADDGLLTSHPHGGVRIDVGTFQSLDAAGRPVPGIHVVGDITRGAVLVTNDATALSYQATLAAVAMRANSEEEVEVS